MSKWKALALAFVIFGVVKIACLFVFTRPGIMERKYSQLREDMTKAEVEAILGQTGATLGGGSLSSSEQYTYVWPGDDGFISISYSDPNNPPIMDTPGMGYRIAFKDFQPSSTFMSRVFWRWFQ